ncbi:hypothetical protein [Pseudomonas frederiksbergensis]|uniref:hypothetical protein n=1 Tax=Pseudomonas frederiksbergensis TaxID=104087 RepID=UPI003D24E30C
MDWDALLDELWSLVDSYSYSSELEVKIRSCVKGFSSEELLQAIITLLALNQHATARKLLSEFLKNHHAAADIQRRLELILNNKQSSFSQKLSLNSKHRSKLRLLKEVNCLVAASKLNIAEQLLADALELGGYPDFLDVLGQVYTFQYRAMDAAQAIQRALLARRQLTAFIESAAPETKDVGKEDVPNDTDLAFINTSAAHYLKLNVVSLQFIEISTADLPGLDDSGRWDDHLFSSESAQLSGGLDSRDQSLSEKEEPSESPKPRTRSILTLTKTRKVIEHGEKKTKVKIFTKTCSSTSPNGPPFLDEYTSEERKDPIDREDQPPLIASSDDIPDTDSEQRLHETESRKFTENEYRADQVQFPVTYVLVQKNTPFPPEDPMGNSLVRDEDSIEELELSFHLQGKPDDRSFYDLEDDTAQQALMLFGISDDTEEESLVLANTFLDREDTFTAYTFDPDEIFDTPEHNRIYESDYLASSVSRKHRALQKASELIANTGWCLSTLPLIQSIFISSGWGATRIALEREIEKGLTPEELVLAKHVKEIWAENDQYWIRFDTVGDKYICQQQLSWPAALLIVRSFEALPQLEEVEVLIESLFETWYGSPYLYEKPKIHRKFKTFGLYLWFRFANLKECLPSNQPLSFGKPSDLYSGEYSDLGDYDLSDFEE